MEFFNMIPFNNGDITIVSNDCEYDLHNFGKFIKLTQDIDKEKVNLYWEYPVKNIRTDNDFKETTNLILNTRFGNENTIILNLIFDNVQYLEIKPGDIELPKSESEVLFEIRIDDKFKDDILDTFEFEFQNSAVIKINCKSVEFKRYNKNNDRV
ncbi:MAG: hypothetical protein ACOYN6_04650 [Ignavibacteria bacterium]|nr:hypothetical protein [Ignavibacteriota bacterium]